MWLLGCSLAIAAPTDVHVGAGAEIGQTSVGILDVGVHHGPWSAAWLTDTLDARYTPESPHGKAWIGVRVEAFAAGLLIVPWADGAPAPDRALSAGDAGPDAGVQRYLSHGWYVGAQAAVRPWWFWSTSAATAPPMTLVATGEAVAGWYKPYAQAELDAGADVEPGRLMPHARVTGQLLRPSGWSPWAQLRAGWGSNQDLLTTTRLGGLSPYVVPLAGAAIAEFRVQDYAAARLGPAWSGDGQRVAVFADGAWYDRATAVGFGASAHLARGPWFTDLAVGASPWLPRQHGTALGGWLIVGWDRPHRTPPG